MSAVQVLLALENGVSQYPKLEGRFPQVSGITFKFDATKQAGSRVDPQSVRIGDVEILDAMGQPLDSGKRFSIS